MQLYCNHNYCIANTVSDDGDDDDDEPRSQQLIISPPPQKAGSSLGPETPLGAPQKP